MKIGWRGAVGALLSGLLLWWTLHDIEFRAVGEALRRSNLTLFLASAAAATAIFAVRARKWRTILDPVAPRLPFGPLWRSTTIGMMVTNLVPARAGELARAYVLSREVPAVPFSASFASIAVDRLFDALALFLLMFLAMLDDRFPRGTHVAGQPVSAWAATGIVALVGVTAVLYLVAFFPARIILLYEAFSRKVAPRFEQRGRDALRAFADGLSVLRSPARFASVLGWTILHWLVNALAFWLGFRAVGIDVPYSAALFLQGLIAVGVAAPSTPGFVGVFEAAARVGLAVYGVQETQAVTWALGFHLLSFIPVTAIGLVYAARAGLHLKDVRAVEPGGPGGAGGAAAASAGPA